MTAALLTFVMSPEVGSLVVSDGLGLADGDALGDPLRLPEADGDGEAVALAEDFALAWPALLSRCEPAACAVPPERDPDGLGVALGESDRLADGDELGGGEPPADRVQPGDGAADDRAEHDDKQSGRAREVPPRPGRYARLPRRAACWPGRGPVPGGRAPGTPRGSARP